MIQKLLTLVAISTLISSCVPQVINVVSDNGICVGQHVDVEGWDSEIYYVDRKNCVILEKVPDMYFDKDGG